jgi:hypothetical protein
MTETSSAVLSSAFLVQQILEFLDPVSLLYARQACVLWHRVSLTYHSPTLSFPPSRAKDITRKVLKSLTIEVEEASTITVTMPMARAILWRRVEQVKEEEREKEEREKEGLEMEREELEMELEVLEMEQETLEMARGTLGVRQEMFAGVSLCNLITPARTSSAMGGRERASIQQAPLARAIWRTSGTESVNQGCDESAHVPAPKKRLTMKQLVPMTTCAECFLFSSLPLPDLQDMDLLSTKNRHTHTFLLAWAYHLHLDAGTSGHAWLPAISEKIARELDAKRARMVMVVSSFRDPFTYLMPNDVPGSSLTLNYYEYLYALCESSMNNLEAVAHDNGWTCLAIASLLCSERVEEEWALVPSLGGDTLMPHLRVTYHPPEPQWVLHGKKMLDAVVCSTEKRRSKYIGAKSLRIVVSPFSFLLQIDTNLILRNVSRIRGLYLHCPYWVDSLILRLRTISFRTRIADEMMMMERKKKGRSIPFDILYCLLTLSNPSHGCIEGEVMRLSIDPHKPPSGKNVLALTEDGHYALKYFYRAVRELIWEMDWDSLDVVLVSLSSERTVSEADLFIESLRKRVRTVLKRENAYEMKVRDEDDRERGSAVREGESTRERAMMRMKWEALSLIDPYLIECGRFVRGETSSLPPHPFHLSL